MGLITLRQTPRFLTEEAAIQYRGESVHVANMVALSCVCTWSGTLSDPVQPNSLILPKIEQDVT
jgi:hypothetical protein